MHKRRRLIVKRLQTQLGDVVYQMAKIHVTQYCPPEGWHPAVNAYQFENALKICVDLAGVDRSLIELTVTEGRLVLRGYRHPPAPAQTEGRAQILAMEIDCGRFEREVALPPQVDAERVTAEHRNGLLWIDVPLRRLE